MVHVGIPGWLVTSESQKRGYSLILSAEGAYKGKQCAVLHGTKHARRGGIIVQTITASDFRGKRVRLRGAVRVEAGSGKSGQAQLWLRVDRPDGHVGFYDDMADRPIVSSNWVKYEILGNIESDAETISFGLHVAGEVNAWLDDLTLEVIPDIAVVNEASRPITPRGMKNLIAFTKLMGYLRYFHPSDEASSLNWNVMALRGVRIVEGALTSAELAARLENFFAPVAPTVRVFPNGKRVRIPSELRRPKNTGLVRVVRWLHYGLPSSTTDPTYLSKRIETTSEAGKPFKPAPLPEEPLRLPLGGGVSALVPLALYSDGTRTFPHGTAASSAAGMQHPIPPWSSLDRATRLAGVALAWNAFQHFYPYFEVVQANWPAELRRALAKAALDADEREFLDTLAQLTVSLRDGHITVQHPVDSGTFRPPLTCDWIEGELVVTHVDDSSPTLKPGDIITKVNGRLAAAALAETAKLISGASLDSVRLRAIYKILRGEENTEIALDLRTSSGVLSSVVLRRVLDVAEYPLERRPAQLKEVAPNIFYVDLDQFTQLDFESNLNKLARSKGIIFDMRGYPSGDIKNATSILPHLTSAPMDSPKWAIPIVSLPDQRGLSFKLEQWSIQPRQPYLSMPLAFLQDARAISYMETLLSFIDYYKLGTIIGQNSAGTNGNVISFSIPGGYRLRFTGLKTLRQDGTRHHAIGIKPGIIVHRTLKGISEGRDEILERAVTALTDTSSTENH